MKPEWIAAAHSATLHEIGMCIVDFDNGSWCRQHDAAWNRERGNTVCAVVDVAYGVAERAVETVEPMFRADERKRFSETMEMAEAEVAAYKARLDALCEDGRFLPDYATLIREVQALPELDHEARVAVVAVLDGIQR